MTHANQAGIYCADFWQAVSERLARLSYPFKQHDAAISHNDVLYAYQAALGDWKLALETDFNNTQEKAAFLHSALKRHAFVACHCVFSALNSDAREQHQDILKQLAACATHHSSHRQQEREIRQQLQNLYGFAELTDISTLVRLQHQP